MTEQVFCIRRTALENMGFLPYRGYRHLAGLQDLLALEQAFIPRPVAEENEEWKQIIPYQLLRHDSRFFVFQRGRAVGEQRLAGRWSIGIGGHVNADDTKDGSMDEAGLLAAAAREFREELDFAGTTKITPVGLINDESDSVGRVHLGLVLLHDLKGDLSLRLRNESEDLTPVGWLDYEGIMAKAGMFEPWSILSLKLIGDYESMI
jgi:predicted NUDIX family phosphoesterase